MRCATTCRRSAWISCGELAGPAAMMGGITVAGLAWTGEFGDLEGILGESGAEAVEFPVQLWQRKLARPEVLLRTKVCSLSGLLHRTDVIPESLLADPEIWKRQAV